MVNNWHTNISDSINEKDKCGLGNDSISVVFIGVIFSVVSAACLLLLAIVVIEARRAKEQYELHCNGCMSPLDEDGLAKMWARKRSSLENTRRNTLRNSSNSCLPSIKENEDKSLADLYERLPPTPIFEVEEPEDEDTFSAMDTYMTPRNRARGVSDSVRFLHSCQTLHQRPN